MPQVAFQPDFTRHKNAAPFKRNDQVFDVRPFGVLASPDSGISDNPDEVDADDEPMESSRGAREALA